MLKFNVTVTNKSTRTLSVCRVALTQHIKFHTKHKTRAQTKEVAEARCPRGIAARDVTVWEGEIKVPSVVGTMNASSSQCKVIEVGYRACLSFDAAGWESDIFVRFVMRNQIL